MKRVDQDRLALAFKLRATPSAVINLHPDMPRALQMTVDPR